MNDHRRINTNINTVLILILAIEVLLSSSFGLNISSNVNVFIVTTILYILYVVYCFFYSIKTNDIFYIVFLGCLVLIFRNSSIIFLSGLALISSRLRINDFVFIYKYAIGIGLTMTTCLSLLGKLPMRNYIDGVISVGFVNENTLGFYLSFFAILTTLKIIDGYITYNFTFINILILILAILFDLFVINYNTAIIMISVYLLFCFFSKFLDKVRHFLSVIFFLLPPFLMYLSYWCALNFGKYGFLQKANEILTNRFLMWHYYVVNFQWGFRGSSWQISKGIWQGYLDGAYFSELLFFGLLAIILTLGLSIINIRLIQSKNWILLSLVVILELCGFAENILFNYNDSFGVIFALLGFYPGKIDGISNIKLPHPRNEK